MTIMEIKKILEERAKTDFEGIEEYCISRNFTENDFKVFYTILIMIDNNIECLQYYYDYQTNKIYFNKITLYPKDVVSLVENFKGMLY